MSAEKISNFPDSCFKRVANSMNAIKILRRKSHQAVLALLLIVCTMIPEVKAAYGDPPAPSTETNTSSSTPGKIRADYDKHNPNILGDPMSGLKKGANGYEAQQGSPVTLPGYQWPEVTPPLEVQTLDKQHEMILSKLKNQLQPTGLPTSDAFALAADTAVENIEMQADGDPEKSMWQASAMGNIMATNAANSLGGMAENQLESAIMFIQGFLTNFTAEAGNQWQAIRTQLFIPMAILLLLPGAVLAQVKAIVAQGSPILGEVSPFDGITRSIIAIFMIPATALIMNYGIDVSNAVQFAIAQGYFQTFGSNMYADALAAEQRAFPVNNESQDDNAIPEESSQQSGASQAAAGAAAGSGGPGGNAVESEFEAENLQTQGTPDEEQTGTMAASRLMMNGTNSTLGMTWNIMCAFQMAFLYYLWCMGPIVAALWVWPMERLRSALPSWIEGVVTLCFWSLFWNTTILLMACFKGIGDTGTVMMTALNALANICVLYAFDFSSLISQGAASQMVGAVGQALSKASSGGGGGQSSGGGQSAGAKSAGGGAAGGGAAGGGAGGGSTGMRTPMQGMRGMGTGLMAGARTGSGSMLNGNGIGGLNSGTGSPGVSALNAGGPGGSSLAAGMGGFVPPPSTANIGGAAGGPGGSPLGGATPGGSFGGGILNAGANGLGASPFDLPGGAAANREAADQLAQLTNRETLKKEQEQAALLNAQNSGNFGNFGVPPSDALSITGLADLNAGKFGSTSPLSGDTAFGSGLTSTGDPSNASLAGLGGSFGPPPGNLGSNEFVNPSFAAVAAAGGFIGSSISNDNSITLDQSKGGNFELGANNGAFGPPSSAVTGLDSIPGGLASNSGFGPFDSNAKDSLVGNGNLPPMQPLSAFPGEPANIAALGSAIPLSGIDAAKHARDPISGLAMTPLNHIEVPHPNISPVGSTNSGFTASARDLSGVHPNFHVVPAFAGGFEHRPVEIPQSSVQATPTAYANNDVQNAPTVYARESADQTSYSSYVQQADASTLGGQPSADYAYVQSDDSSYQSAQAQQQEYYNTQAQQAAYYASNQAQQAEYYNAQQVQAQQQQQVDYNSQPVYQDNSTQYQSTVFDSSSPTVIVGQPSYQSQADAYAPAGTPASQRPPEADAYLVANPSPQQPIQDASANARSQPQNRAVIPAASGAIAGFASVFAKHPKLGGSVRTDGYSSSPQQIIRSSPSGAPPASRVESPKVTDKAGLQGQITALKRGGGKKWTKEEQDKFLKKAWDNKEDG